MITYNHEKFIAEAIEGVLMQETSFPIELVIGDDCSTDRTGAIAKSFQEKYPDKIRILERNSNLGMKRNFADTLTNCRGKFIALCEGDDYWTDPGKLQKQVSILEDDERLVMCCHADRVLSEDGKIVKRLLAAREVQFEDILEMYRRREYLPTMSWVFKNQPKLLEPEAIRDNLFDITLLLLLASKGSIRIMSDIMAVYRVHSTSYTNSGDNLRKQIMVIDALEKAKAFFNPRGEKEFDKFLAPYYADAMFLSYSKGHHSKFRDLYLMSKHLFKYLPFRTLVAIRWRNVLSASTRRVTIIM